MLLFLVSSRREYGSAPAVDRAGNVLVSSTDGQVYRFPPLM